MIITEKEFIHKCSLTDKEVKISDGYVPTAIGTKIPQHGCSNEYRCPSLHDKQCLVYKPR